MEISRDDYTLLQELAQQFDYPDYDPKIHVTLNQLVELWGLTKNGARDRMTVLCMEGKFKKITVRRDDNRPVTAYKKAM